MQLEAASGNLQAVMSPRADQVPPELSSQVVPLPLKVQEGQASEYR